MLLFQLFFRLPDLNIPDAAASVDLCGPHKLVQHGHIVSCIHRDIRTPGQLCGEPGVPLGILQSRVASHCHDPPHIQMADAQD